MYVNLKGPFKKCAPGAGISDKKKCRGGRDYAK